MSKKSLIRYVTRRKLDVTYNGKSSDFIPPPFGMGCLYKCAYCYMRRNKPYGIDLPNNIDEILNVIVEHSKTVNIKKPNQVDPKYITYDIGVLEDFALHAKYYDVEKIYNTFINNDKIKATFATKFVNKKLLQYNPNKKVRIRFTLMPQTLSNKLEPNTSKIIDRINAINLFRESDYDVHLNLSPVIMYPEWKQSYSELFSLLTSIPKDVKFEVIFLTHNDKLHEYNKKIGFQYEDLLYNPQIQEYKISQHTKQKNLRYKLKYKQIWIEQFKELLYKYTQNEIRYIF